VDSQPFYEFSLLIVKSIKVIEENSPGETNPPRCTFFYYNILAGKRLNSCQVCVLLDQFNECEGTRSLDDLFNFRESEMILTMDSGGVPSL
jgi:hypothetical protein